jgi:AraC family multidrug resistance transcriptional activator
MAMQKSVILDIQTWIDNNIDKPLRINDVAHRAGYSKWHLQRLFHQIIDIPLGVYIRNKKLEGAAHDLSATNESIITISTRYGFDSQQTFTGFLPENTVCRRAHGVDTTKRMRGSFPSATLSPPSPRPSPRGEGESRSRRP